MKKNQDRHHKKNVCEKNNLGIEKAHSKKGACERKDIPCNIHKIRVHEHFAANPLPVLRKENLAEGIPTDAVEGDLLHLVDRFGRTVGTALLGVQPRSVGWMLSGQTPAPLNASYFARKLSNAFSKRISFLKSPKTNVFRVFNGEGDGIGGLTIDYYDSHFLISYYNAGIYRYCEEIREAIRSSADFQAIVEKKRFGDNQDGEVCCGEIRTNPLICKENDVAFAVDLINGGMTGIFADQREVRKAIRNKFARGKKVLNLFSYTAMFSVFAALGGAKTTTNVDLAKRSHEIAKSNYALNKIESDAHEFIANDVFAFLKEAEKNEYKYDLIIIDPPSFSNSSHGAFSSEKGLGRLIEASTGVAQKNALFIISTNNSRISLEKFRKIVSERLIILEEFSLPSDYRTARELEESHYLKVAVCKIR